MEIWLIFAITTCIAGVVLGFTGFGGALVMAPVFLTIIDPVTATAIILIVNAVAGVANLRAVGAETDWTIARPLCIAACIASPIGLWLLNAVDVDAVRQLVAGAVFVASTGLALRWRFPFSIRSRLGNAVFGFSSGSLFGIGGVGGPPVIIGMLAENLPALVTRATLLTYFAVVQTFTLLLMVLQGAVSWRSALLGLALAPVYVLGNRLGLRLLTPERAGIFRKVSIATLFAVAGYALLPR